VLKNGEEDYLGRYQNDYQYIGECNRNCDHTLPTTIEMSVFIGIFSEEAIIALMRSINFIIGQGLASLRFGPNADVT